MLELTKTIQGTLLLASPYEMHKKKEKPSDDDTKRHKDSSRGFYDSWNRCTTLYDPMPRSLMNNDAI